jgi:hypothetical protein
MGLTIVTQELGAMGHSLYDSILSVGVLDLLRKHVELSKFDFLLPANVLVQYWTRLDRERICIKVVNIIIEGLRIVLGKIDVTGFCFRPVTGQSLLEECRSCHNQRIVHVESLLLIPIAYCYFDRSPVAVNGQLAKTIMQSGAGVGSYFATSFLGLHMSSMVILGATEFAMRLCRARVGDVCM